jgi:hypothetical protein
MESVKSLKFLVAIFAIFAFSCEDDIEDNSNAFQVVVQNEFWRAKTVKASILDDGTLIIVASDGERKMIVQTASFQPGNYAVGVSAISEITYENSLSNSAVKTLPFLSKGVVEISRFNSEKPSVTGTFRFDALSNTGIQYFFKEGIFYELDITEFNPDLLKPIEDGDDDTDGGDDTGGGDNGDNGGGDDPDLPFSNHFFAKVNGNPFSSQVITVSVSNGAISVMNATTTGLPSMTIQFPADVTAGVHNFGGGNINAAFYTPNGIDRKGESGSLFIDKHDTVNRIVEGRFNFTVPQPGNPIEVTEGAFRIKY